MNNHVVAMDPSLSAFGVAIIDIDKNKLIHGQCIKSPSATGINIEIEPFVRMREIVTPLLRLIDDYHCIGMVAEVPTFGKDYKSMLMSGRIQGILGSIPVFVENTRGGLYFPALGVLPIHIKGIAKGLPNHLIEEAANKLNVTPNVNKHQVVARVAMEYPNLFDFGNNATWRVEAIADACGAWICGKRDFEFLYELGELPNYRAQINQKKQPTHKMRKMI